ncbi:M20/M25/M40 family metallo-hydrolase [uncultured Arcticibacterium sp.]|uniref:M20/M25/M40 family metallo-hydrolase n=1 Tax=uncultured Arcticibacterium sp. TaxID=2173042 RepID=UPI0030F52F7D
MKKYSILFFSLLSIGGLQAQKFKKVPESKLQSSEVEKHIRFLASDELMGRETGHAGNNAAARYIAEEFRSYGLSDVNAGSFYQQVPFEFSYQPENALITAGENTLKIGEDFLLMNGGGVHQKNVEKVHLPYGWVSEDGAYDDFEGIDVKGKVLVVSLGMPDAKGFREMLGVSKRKEEIAKEKGALALIEIFSAPIPWGALVNNFGDGSISLKEKDATDFTRILVSSETAKKISKGLVDELDIDINIMSKKSAESQNVIGMVQGSDPVLSKEFVVLTAHFDHVGINENAEEGEDYIFNGARDNAIGVAGLLSAAKSLAAKPGKRSVLFIAYTGEEIGLRGSGYYAENPLIPLKQCVFNLNIDGAGYNDKTKVTGLGIARTGAEAEITKAVEAVGLTLIDDPTPELGLFDRSDNVRLAAKGIPAPSFSPGFTSFDDEIAKYYHKEADEAESLDFEYCTQFCKSYAFAARLIANKKDTPVWVSGDKYEPAAKELYKD